jgi:hypothetical protein
VFDPNIAKAPIEVVGIESATEDQLAPPFVVRQIPPSAAPAKMMFGSVPWQATAEILPVNPPEMVFGPMNV